MKKVFFLLMAGVLLMGANLYAGDGDLIVDGKVGIGTETPTAKLDVRGKVSVSGEETYLFDINLNQTHPDYPATGMLFVVNRSGIADQTNATVGLNFTLNNAGAGNITEGLASSITSMQFVQPGTHEVSSLATNYGARWRGFGGIWNITSTVSNYKSSGIDAVVSGSLNFSDFRHIWISNSSAGSFSTGHTQTGLWIDKQTRASDIPNGGTDYGIVLNGDGSVGDYGSAVVLGANQNASLYGKTDGVYVYDGTNETKISPHDPETGEWIYYSKNIKTGKVVRVDMERLVKDMEELTGKKYITESVTEDR